MMKIKEQNTEHVFLAANFRFPLYREDRKGVKKYKTLLTTMHDLARRNISGCTLHGSPGDVETVEASAAILVDTAMKRNGDSDSDNVKVCKHLGLDSDVG